MLPLTPLAARAWPALVLALGLPAAQAAQIPQTSASAGGIIYGQGGGDLDESFALARVTAEVVRAVRPSAQNAASLSAMAEAQAGLLKARASLSLLNAPANTGFSYYNQAEGYAQFHDDWLITGQPLDTPGRLRLTLRFAGTVEQAALIPARPTGFGQFTFDLSSVRENENSVDSLRELFRIDNGSASETRTVELDFLYGRRISVAGYLLARAEITVPPGTYIATGESSADFSHTAALTQLEVWDADAGRYSASVQLQTSASTLYPFQAPVPEPGTLALACGGLAALGSVAAVRRCRRPSAPAGA